MYSLSLPVLLVFYSCNVADSPGFSNTFTPFATRTQQYVKEQLGQADEKV